MGPKRTTPQLIAGAAVWASLLAASLPSPAAPDELTLAEPRLRGPVSLEASLAQRRSVRQFAPAALTSADIGQLLWAAQGESSAAGRRTAPSAGAIYPLGLYLVAGRVEGIAAGVHRYLPSGHRLAHHAEGDLRACVAAAAPGQVWMGQAPALFVIAAQPARMAARYGARADRFIALEAGAAAQNLLLQAAALGLGGTLVGAFDETALRRCLPLAEAEQPLVLLVVGRGR